MTGMNFRHIYQATSVSALASGAAAQEIIADPNADTHQLDAWGVTATAGTVAWEYQTYLGPDVWLVCKDQYGAAVTTNLAARVPMRWSGTASKLRATISGANGTWNYGVVGK